MGLTLETTRRRLRVIAWLAMLALALAPLGAEVVMAAGTVAAHAAPPCPLHQDGSFEHADSEHADSQHGVSGGGASADLVHDHGPASCYCGLICHAAFISADPPFVPVHAGDAGKRIARGTIVDGDWPAPLLRPPQS